MQIGTWTTTLTNPFQQNYLLSTASSTELNKLVLHLNSLQRKWITFTKSYKITTTQHNSFNKANPQQKANKKPNPSTVKFIEVARVVIPNINGLSEQYRHTPAKYRLRDFFQRYHHHQVFTHVSKRFNSRCTDNWYNLLMEMPSQQLHSRIHRSSSPEII